MFLIYLFIIHTIFVQTTIYSHAINQLNYKDEEIISIIYPSDHNIHPLVDETNEQQSSSFSANVLITHDNTNSINNKRLIAQALQQARVDHFLQKCNMQQFKQYLTDQNITTTKELVAHVEWWKYPIFWDYVEFLSDAHEELLKFEKEFLNKYKLRCRRALDWWINVYQEGTWDLVHEKLQQHYARYKEKEEKKIEDEARARVQKQLDEQLYHNIVMDYQQVRPLLSYWQTSDNKRWQQRATVWLNNKKKDIDFTTHQFQLTSVQQQFCALNGDQLGVLYGMAFQKQLHQELLDCIEIAVPLHHDHLFVSSVRLAHESNCAGFIHKSSLLIDLCYAIAGGIFDGTANTACHMYETILHPIDTAIGTIKATYTVVKALGVVAKIPIELAYYCITDSNTFYTRCTDIYNYNDALYNLAADYFHTTSSPKIARDATGLITELILTDQFLRLTTTLCAGLAKKIPALIQEYVADAEHIPIDMPGLTVEKAELFAKQKQISKTRYGGNIARAVTELEKECATVNTIKEFFEKRSFGKYIKNYCEKVNLYCQHEPCFKILKKSNNKHLRKGDIFCLDKSHKNHLEVFDRLGKGRCVLDLDGTLNIKKTNTMLSQNRTLF